MFGKERNIKRDVSLYRCDFKLEELINSTGGTANQRWMSPHTVCMIYSVNLYEAVSTGEVEALVW